LSDGTTQTSWCGDGVVDEDAGEECDDANNDDHDSCTGRPKCWLPYPVFVF